MAPTNMSRSQSRGRAVSRAPPTPARGNFLGRFARARLRDFAAIQTGEAIAALGAPEVLASSIAGYAINRAINMG